MKDNLSGTSLHTQVKTYRMNVLEISLSANISMSQLDRLRPALDLKGPKALSVRNARDLFCTDGVALKTKQHLKLKWLIDCCHDNFSCTIDGSPIGVNAECVIIWMVRKDDHKIIELLLSLHMYKIIRLEKILPTISSPS